jgi:hypothetical protein
MELEFCAADFETASDGSLRFLEINTSPMFAVRSGCRWSAVRRIGRLALRLIAYGEEYGDLAAPTSASSLEDSSLTLKPALLPLKSASRMRNPACWLLFQLPNNQ